jgi:hypothetical protein
MKKFYRTVVQVEILSESPYESSDLEQIAADTDTGGCSGMVTDVVRNEEVDGKKMAELLRAQGSDPGFFQIDEDGKSTEDDIEFERVFIIAPKAEGDTMHLIVGTDAKGNLVDVVEADEYSHIAQFHSANDARKWVKDNLGLDEVEIV